MKGTSDMNRHFFCNIIKYYDSMRGLEGFRFKASNQPTNYSIQFNSIHTALSKLKKNNPVSIHRKHKLSYFIGDWLDNSARTQTFNPIESNVIKAVICAIKTVMQVREPQ